MKRSKPSPELLASDLPRLARQALADVRVVVRAYAGEAIRPLSFARITRAAIELHLPPPSSTNASSREGLASEQSGGAHDHSDPATE